MIQVIQKHGRVYQRAVCDACLRHRNGLFDGLCMTCYRRRDKAMDARWDALYKRLGLRRVMNHYDLWEQAFRCRWLQSIRRQMEHEQ